MPESPRPSSVVSVRGAEVEDAGGSGRTSSSAVRSTTGGVAGWLSNSEGRLPMQTTNTTYRRVDTSSQATASTSFSNATPLPVLLPSPEPPPTMPAIARGAEQHHRVKYMMKLGLIPGIPRVHPYPRSSSIQEAPDRLERTPFHTWLADAQQEKRRSDVSVAEFQMSMSDLQPKDDFRVNYLKKLSYANVWIPNSRRAPKHQTVTIFDWDDTLLCTSFIQLKDERKEPLSEAIWARFYIISQKVVTLIETAKKMGRVFIITNAMEGWVEHSAKKYLPAAVPLLSKMNVISARNRFEAIYPGDVYEWKIQAFLEVCRQLNSEIVTNLISVGDSDVEMDAVHVMGKEFSQALVKTIKFRENPTPDEIIKEMDLVIPKFENICHDPRNLRIGLQRKWMTPSRESNNEEPASPLKRSPSVMSGVASNAGSLPIQENFQDQQDEGSKNTE